MALRQAIPRDRGTLDKVEECAVKRESRNAAWPGVAEAIRNKKLLRRTEGYAGRVVGEFGRNVGELRHGPTRAGDVVSQDGLLRTAAGRELPDDELEVLGANG